MKKDVKSGKNANVSVNTDMETNSKVNTETNTKVKANTGASAKNRRMIRKLEPYFFMAPSYLLLLGFVAYPLANCIRMAFLDYRLAHPNGHPFIGFDNFKKVFMDSDILLIVQNTLVFVIATVSLQFILGMTLALALKKPFRLRKAYQAIVFLPWSLSSFIVGLNFRWLFNGEYGPINDLLLKSGLITEKLVMLGSAQLSLLTVIIALTWWGIPFFGIMLLAALQSIPEDFYEAASLEGCGGVRSFFLITLPTIKPTVVITVLLRVIWVFNNADLIYVMTKGGPANTSHTLSSYMFTKAYSTLDFGMASALGVMFIVILILFALFFMQTTKYSETGGD